MADSNAAGGSPAFEDAFDGEDVEQRIYGTVLGTREPTTARTIATSVECDPKTARKYLEWFADLGIVRRHDGRPVTYERNDAYFEWRRIERLAARTSAEELRRRVRDLTETITSYEATYGASTPAAVDALATVEGEPDRTIDDVYGDLADWQTAREERRLHERARRRRADTTERDEASG